MSDSTAPSEAHVLTERRDSTLLITFNRPDRLNAWTGQMQQEYFDALQGAANDPDVRAIVVTGAGRGFCAGADMENLSQIGASGEVEARADRRIIYPLSVHKPVIAAINGACAGMGVVQALMCDVRFAAPDIKITTAFSKIGLIAEHGTSWLLSRIVGISNALDLLMSARAITSDEAAAMGLVNRVTTEGDVVNEALAYADLLARTASPQAMATIKSQIYRHAVTDIDTALAESDVLMHESIAGGELAEGVAAFTERRAPRFEGLNQSLD